jgi:hypothetical protein
MSSISGLGSTLASLLAGTTDAGAAGTGTTPEQQAEMIAESEQTTLGNALIAALSPADTSDTYGDVFGPAYDLSPNLFDYAYGAIASNAQLGVANQLGSLTPPSQWQQIQTPDMTTPGQSESVDPADQLSYLQTVPPSANGRTTPSLGTIGTNAGRLVVLGALSSDQSDVQSYSFNLQEAGQLHILAPDPNSSDPTASLGAVHMQVYDSSGNLMADSDPSSGEAYLAYVKLDQTALAGADFSAGQYTIKLSYAANAPADAKGDFSLFIESGTDPGATTFYTDATGDTANEAAAAAGAQAETPQNFVPALDLLA